MRQLLEGSQAVARAVAACRPQVVSAYPITPQTHIVEGLAELAQSGQLAAQCLNVESEFAAISVVLGATASGSRAYTATSSQGLLLMTEVLYNIAGLRLPVVMTCANRAVSAPLSIWNDHQDVMSVRDCGWILLFAANNQEAADLHPQAYRLAELLRIPVMVNVDGFILTHAFEPVELPEPEQTERFLPPASLRLLDPAQPRSIGMMAEPQIFLETRFAQHQAVRAALEVIPRVGEEFGEVYGRPGIQLVKPYRLEGATTVVVSLGSISGTIHEAVDELREVDQPVGALEIQTFRPFPAEELRRLLGERRTIVVLDKSLTPGSADGGTLVPEIKAALYGCQPSPRVISGVLGLGGRDVTIQDVKRVVVEAMSDESGEGTRGPRFVGLKRIVLNTVEAPTSAKVGEPEHSGVSR